MDRILIKNGRLFINKREIENYHCSVDGGVIDITGNEVEFDFAWNKIYDKEKLAEIRPQYIQKSWLTKKPYVQGWYQLKKTTPVVFQSTCFSLER